MNRRQNEGAVAVFSCSAPRTIVQEENEGSQSRDCDGSKQRGKGEN